MLNFQMFEEGLKATVSLNEPSPRQPTCAKDLGRVGELRSRSLDPNYDYSSALGVFRIARFTNDAAGLCRSPPPTLLLSFFPLLRDW